MLYVEVAVNVPIRPTFRKQYADAPPPEPVTGEPSLFDEGFVAAARKPNVRQEPARGLQTFHYHLPVEFENSVQLGHLVWVPFGRQEVQGIVLGRAESAPVETKAVLRLARPEPIISPTHIALAEWIAHRYVAPLAEALKLFLPPGLLTKKADDGTTRRGARVKRELQVELLADAQKIAARLPTLGNDSKQAQVVAWLLDHPDAQPTRQQLQDACGLRSPSALNLLIEKGLILSDDAGVRLRHPADETRQALITMRGADKFVPILDLLQEEDEPLWKSNLYANLRERGHETNLATLRTLQKSGLIQLSDKIRFRDPLAGRTYRQTSPPPLTSDQQAVWTKIETFCEQRAGESTEHPLTHSFRHQATATPPHFLLHGVTGSGKTEIYLRLIDKVLRAGKQAVVLVPEIALTPQTVARFAGRFPDRVTVIHSELNQGERYDVWRHVRDGNFDVVIGPRSALFAPLPRLGLIIIDEEHETSYKQNAEAWGSFTVFYDARAVARHLARITNSIFLLGSATPSLESYHAAMQEAGPEKLHLLEMTRRVLGHRQMPPAPTPSTINNQQLTINNSNGQNAVAQDLVVNGQRSIVNGQPSMAHDDSADVYAEMPPVELVDMRQELRVGNRSIFSRSLAAQINRTLDADEQVILFLNRRGTNTFVSCRDCGHVEKCGKCDTPLTYHERASVLVCHHCNSRFPIPEICPECDSKRIKFFGSGTQRIEEVVRQITPQARILRWDADTTGRRGSHEEILRRFADGEANVLVGTQMIAKGLDLPMVTLVGIISADTALYLPDFRSGERTFQLLTQVAGRAGRGERGGRVVLQTYTPEHYAIQAAAQHDFHAFYRREIAFREEHGYPPIGRLLRLIYWDKKLEKAEKASAEMAKTLRSRLREIGLTRDETSVMGPAPAFFARFRGYYRWQIVLRAPDPAAVLRGLPIPFGWRIDVDPVSML